MSMRMRDAASYLAIAAFLIVLALTGMSGCGGGSNSSSGSSPSTKPSITSFGAASPTITAGGSTTLSWSVTGAASLSIDNSVGTVTGTSVSVKPSTTTTYILTATSSEGTTATAQVTVTVVAAPSIASFTAASSTITAGGSVTLNWSVTGAASLSIDNSVGTVTGTSVSVKPSATTTYTLTATNAAGMPVTAQVTVTVVPAPAIASFTTSAATITVGNSTTLSWSVSNSSSVSIDNNIGAVTGTSISVSPTATTTYTLTATNAAGTPVTAQVKVTVVPAPAIASFTASPATITVGNSTTLNWSVSNSSSVSIDNSVGAVTGTSISVSPTAETTYTLTATNAAGTSVTAQVTVTTVPAAKISSFTATPSILNPVTLGTTTATLSWSTADATTVSIDNGVGTLTGTSISVSPKVTTTYTLTATNSLGTSVTATATVGVRNNLALLAGVPYLGSDIDGTGSSATFFQPKALATDASGNIYVADTLNNEIRKVTPDGVVTTIAGGAALTTGTKVVRSGSSRAQTEEAPSRLKGDTKSIRAARQALLSKLQNEARSIHPESTNSLIAHAGLSDPQGIAVSSDGGTIYVADSGNDVIRKIVIASDGTATMSTFAGTVGAWGSTDGTGTAAHFFNPAGIALDAGGNIFVADSGNQTIRKITPAGEVTTLAGKAGFYGSTDGTGTTASFDFPQGITVDASGNLYVADTNNSLIRKITPAGVVTTLAGSLYAFSYADGTGSAARFYLPTGITIDTGGYLYVADGGNNVIRKITPSGEVTTLAGRTGGGMADGTGTAASFDLPEGITVDVSGNLYVADTGNNEIRKITPAGVVTTLAGGASHSIGSTDGTGTAARFSYPMGIAVDADSNVYVADTENSAIRKITAAGVVTTLAGGTWGSADGTGTAASFSFPEGITVDADGNLYVADTDNDTIRKITPDGAVTTLAGKAGSAGSTDGTGTAALFDKPLGIAADASGNIYVADRVNSTIRKITSAGVVTTLAGKAGTVGSTDGTGTVALFNSPEGIAVDAGGNVYVADTGSQTIRKITAAGVVTTQAGQAGIYGYADGAGTAALFNTPTGIAVDVSGNLYVSETGDNVIRKIVIASDGTATVSTIIGVYGNPENSMGLLPAALDQPMGIAADSTGNLYILVPNAVLTLEP